MKSPSQSLTPGAIDVIKKSVYTKSSQWSYENEVRYIRIINQGEPRCYTFRRSRLKKIILGASISTENFESVKRLKNKYYEHAELIQLSTSSKRYLLKRKVVK